MQNLQKFLLNAVALAALSACGGADDMAAEPASDANSTAASDDVMQLNAAHAKHGLYAGTVRLKGGKDWLPIHGRFSARDFWARKLSVVRIEVDGQAVNPQEGVYTLKTGVLEIRGLDFVFTPLGGEATSFAYVVSNGRHETVGTVQIGGSVSDPLAREQWHLRNTGQTGYSMSDSVVATLSQLYQRLNGWSAEQADARAAQRRDFSVLKPGEDLNVLGAYAQGSTGQGTIAVVVDSGLEIRHEDLVGNVLPNRSWNMVPGVSDVTDPTSTETAGDHGTSVAGLIAAVGWNGLGGRGVAPDAKLIGLNMLAYPSALNIMLSHGGPGSRIADDEPVAVINRSYGLLYPAAYSYSESEEALHAYSAQKLRGGKGAVTIKSAGNGFGESGDPNNEDSLCANNGANRSKLTCFNANLEPRQNTPYYFIVGAVNSNGLHSSYSSAGANLLVVAPAGEYGDLQPAMVTTDQSTCLLGYSSVGTRDEYDGNYFPGYYAGYYPFNGSGHPDNVNCNYISNFNGTTSAAANTSGVVALILAANPALSYRDVRDIFVKSSTQVDPTNKTVSLNTGEGAFVAHSGWVRNAAGYAFNNLYGFGRVNAGRAVQLAKAATPLPTPKMGSWQGRGVYELTGVSRVGAEPLALNLPVPDNSAKGATVTIDVADDIKLEGMQFKFSISNADFGFGMETDTGVVQSTAGMDLAIEVVSPAGTRSVLLSSKQALVSPAETWEDEPMPGYILKDAVLLSNAFYGESAKGQWSVRVFDLNGSDYTSRGGKLNVSKYVNNSAESKIEGIALRVFGH